MASSPNPRLAKSGGYPEEIFIQMTEEEKEKYLCHICYMIVRQPCECTLGHIFCSSCISTWLAIGTAGKNKCPVCRSAGYYRPLVELESSMAKRRVRCFEKHCIWTGLLQNYRRHMHFHDHLRKSSPSEQITLNFPLYHGDTEGEFREASRRDISRNNQGMFELLDQFADRLERRRRNVISVSQQRERMRTNQPQQLRNIERHLGDLTGDLVRLLDNMSADARRYQSYIRPTPSISPRIPMAQNTANRARIHFSASSRRQEPSPSTSTSGQLGRSGIQQRPKSLSSSLTRR